MRDPKSQNESDVTVSPTLGIFVPNFGRVWCKKKMCGYLAFILGTYIPKWIPDPQKRKRPAQKQSVSFDVFENIW
jgi:hypothetical protein